MMPILQISFAELIHKCNTLILRHLPSSRKSNLYLRITDVHLFETLSLKDICNEPQVIRVYSFGKGDSSSIFRTPIQLILIQKVDNAGFCPREISYASFAERASLDTVTPFQAVKSIKGASGCDAAFIPARGMVSDQITVCNKEYPEAAL